MKKKDEGDKEYEYKTIENYAKKAIEYFKKNYKDDLDFKSFGMDAKKLKDKGIYSLYFFSTTRNKLLYIKDPKIKGSVVRIVLDGDKLTKEELVLLQKAKKYLKNRMSEYYKKLEDGDQRESGR